MSRGHKIVANFLKARGAWDNKPTTVSSYTGADAVKPAAKKPKLDAKVLNSYVGRKVVDEEAKVKVHQPGYNPPPAELISSADDAPSGEMTAPVLGGKKSLDKIKEAAAKKAEPPFEPDPKPSKPVTAGKHGEGYSRARHLARKGLQQMLQINPKIAEAWSDAVLDQLSEVHPAVMAMAQAGARKDLKAQADKHTELALAANKAGDDAKVKFHQAQVAKIKARMQAEGYIDRTRGTGAAYRAISVKGKTVIEPNPYKDTAQKVNKKDNKLPMSKAAGVLAAEETEQIDELSKKALSSYASAAEDDLLQKQKAIKNTPGSATSLKHARSMDMYKRMGNVAKAYKKIVAKEETLDELKARTLQSYADKAHQQALDATYDAAHLNRSGEEQLKANAKKLAAKRSGGVQLAQSKLDRKYNAAGDAYRAHTGTNSNKLYNKEETETTAAPLALAHGIGDLVTCKRTNRLATVVAAEGDKYTVVYADGSTETGDADWWTPTRDISEARVVEQPRGWNVKHLKPAGHGIVGKKVRSYDFPGFHDSHYIEGHVTDEDPQSYHIRTTKVVRHNKEEPIPAHLTHIRAPKGLHIFGNAQGVYYAPKEVKAKPAVKKTLGSLRSKR